MWKTLLILRIVFFSLCVFTSVLICYSVPEWDPYLIYAAIIGACIGGLVILVDMLLKGFSLRGLSALTFGLFIGWIMAHFISISPLFEYGDPQVLFIARISLFIILMYISSVVALRGKDEFSLVIPYVKFTSQQVDVPVAVVDTSILIDGRIVGICESKFMGYQLVIPQFILDELQHIADSHDPQRQAKGRKGLEVINKLRRINGLDLRIHESEVDNPQKVDAKLLFLCESLKAKLLTMDYNLSRLAEFHNIDWLNLNALVKALNTELIIGETLEIDLVKPGREPGQAVGFLTDGSMVVVNDGIKLIGQKVEVEVQSILPSAGGKMIFARTKS